MYSASNVSPDPEVPLIVGIGLFGMVGTVRGFSFGRAEPNKASYEANELSALSSNPRKA